MVSALVTTTLQALGLNVIDLGLSTTPTVELAVSLERADGGIILTASHNPIQWNALKLLNELGEFISAADGAEENNCTSTLALVFEYILMAVESNSDTACSPITLATCGALSMNDTTRSVPRPSDFRLIAPRR